MTTPEPVPAVDAEAEALRVAALDPNEMADWVAVAVSNVLAALTASQAEAAALRVENAAMREMRKRLDKRIHDQRRAFRDTWEIVESRQKGLRSSAVYCIVKYREAFNRATAAETEAAALRGAAEVWPISTDDQVEALARECEWDNRRYMTPADYAIWCERMRKFALLAAETEAAALKQRVVALEGALAAEREACAKIADEHADNCRARIDGRRRTASDFDIGVFESAISEANSIAIAIRARNLGGKS